ncbi:lipocalin family protein [uncultured Dokdonia sp.]|uniref:lipocalin family protein n=1 Tax=uncultured Dokdonia sp. TaxID=575653 RepID=UPI0026196043|nr:lipocalin family protein [uncultured Dokdonia sp.]
MCTMILSSCGTSKTIKESKKTLKGNWTLNDITYNRDGVFNVTIFGDTSAECLEGSTWQFIPNNNFGNYEITSSNCPAGKRYFIWALPGSDQTDPTYDIILKPTDEKKNSTMDEKGFRLSISYLSENQLQFEQKVQLEGKPFVIRMNFSKNLK